MTKPENFNLKIQNFNTSEEINGETLSEYAYIKSDKPSPIKIIVVSGNPGIIDFYYDFIKILFLALNGKYDVYAIGHIGHCGRIEKCFSVEEQIKHKELFLEYLLENQLEKELFEKEECKFILLGHSVGSYISLKLLNRYSDKFQFLACCNLFPTFKNLYDGLSPFIKMVVMRESTRSGFSTFLHYIPNLMRHAILRFVLAENDSRISVNGKINYWSALNILYMAYTEALDIKEIDDECFNVFDTRLNQLLFIYGQTDNYTPRSFYEEMKDKYPNGSIELAPHQIPHAFVLHHSKDIALRVSEWLENRILNNY